MNPKDLFSFAASNARAEFSNVIPLPLPKWYARAQIDSDIPVIKLAKALASEGFTVKYTTSGVLRIEEAK